MTSPISSAKSNTQKSTKDVGQGSLRIPPKKTIITRPKTPSQKQESDPFSTPPPEQQGAQSEPPSRKASYQQYSNTPPNHDQIQPLIANPGEQEMEIAANALLAMRRTSRNQNIFPLAPKNAANGQNQEITRYTKLHLSDADLQDTDKAADMEIEFINNNIVNNTEKQNMDIYNELPSETIKEQFKNLLADIN